MSSFTADDLDEGRRLFAADWQFFHAAASIDGLPPMADVEIALAGRSNVGKSSLINALTGRKALARTSHTPGRTQELIFFRNGRGLTLVDMPGYGFAAAPKARIAAWTSLILAYLKGRANLARVYLLVDARHGFKAADEVVLATLDQAAVSYQAVLTKADEVKDAARGAITASVVAGLQKRPAAFPEVIVTSARSGEGLAELRAAVARLLAEKAKG